MLLAALHTWPLITDPAHLSRNDASDTMLNSWIVSWVAYQLPRDPSRLFDANIFYPEPNILAFSEPLIVPGTIAVPLRWLGASPVLCYNLLLLSGFVLTALAMYLLALRLTGDHLAGIFAGSLLAFNAHTMTRLPQLQAIFAAGVPLALWALDRVLTRRQTRDALWLGLSVAMTALTSGYQAMFVAFMLPAAVLARPESWWGKRALPALGRLVVAALVAGVLALPVARAYGHAREQQGTSRAIESIAQYSAVPASYLTTVGRVHFEAWSHQMYAITHDKFFPGFVAIALALIALRAGPCLKTPGARMFLAVGLVGFVMSLGTATPVHEWAYRIFPPMRGIRAAGRFGYLVLLAVAGLSAYGLALLRRRQARSRWITPLAVVCIVGVNLEAIHAPIPYERFDGFPPIYRMIARLTEPDAVLIELPIYPRERIFLNASYVLASTEHWRRLVNGYSGFVPARYRTTARRMGGFPDERSMGELRRHGVTHVLVHPDRFSEGGLDVLRRADSDPELRLVARDPKESSLYELLPARDGEP
jgi:hypothetical protein